MAARVAFAAENAPLIKVLGQPQSFGTDSPQSRGKTANESLCEEVETWPARRGWHWCLRICLEKQHAARKEMNKNVTLGDKKNKTKRKRGHGMNCLNYFVWALSIKNKLILWFRRTFWECGNCAPLWVPLFLSRIFFRKWKGKKTTTALSIAVWSCGRKSFKTEPHTVPYLLTLTAFEKGYAADYSIPCSARGRNEKKDFWRLPPPPCVDTAVVPPGSPRLRRGKKERPAKQARFNRFQLTGFLIVSHWSRPREGMMRPGKIKQRKRGGEIKIKEGKEIKHPGCGWWTRVSSSPSHEECWGWGGEGGDERRRRRKRRFVWINMFFERDVRNWDSGGIADVPGLSVLQTQDTHK